MRSRLSASTTSPIYSGASSTCLSVTFLEMYPGSSQCTAVRHLLYQSTARERHHLALKGKSLGYAIGRVGAPGDPGRRVESSREGREGAALDPLRVPRWGHRLVTAWADFELDGPLRASLLYGKDGNTVIVENRSSLHLRDSFVTLWQIPEYDSWPATLDIGSIPAGESLRIPDLEMHFPPGLVPSEKVSEEVVRFLGPNPPLYPWTFWARVDARSVKQALDVEYDEHTLPLGNYAFVTVPIRQINESGKELLLGGDPRSWALHDDEDPEGEMDPVYEEWYPAPLKGKCRLETMILMLDSGERASDQRIFDWTRREWVELPGEVEENESPDGGEVKTRVIIQDPDRFVLRPERVIVTGRIRQTEGSPQSSTSRLRCVYIVAKKENE